MSDQVLSNIVGYILSFARLDEYYEFYYSSGETGRVYILNDHVVRFYMAPTGRFSEYPKPVNVTDTAKINIKTMSDYGLEAFKQSVYNFDDITYTIDTPKIRVSFDKLTANMSILDKITNKVVIDEAQSLCYYDKTPTQTLKQERNEYFYGGGMQNGRFTHKGKTIEISNTNNWVDGGVSSPSPFYWSTNGYGALRNTWQSGSYDFGSKSSDMISISHKSECGDFDVFYFINSKPKDILNDYYELTGRPLLLPEYAFYEAHFDAFNRDYWVEVSKDTNGAILFEDGKYYKCFNPKDMTDKKGILESLNGEKNNYQFSARAMIDRYKRHDMPLGWFIPNDGYGCGYGQTDTFDGDIKNLTEFAEYSRSHGVQVALWTESKLHPADPNHPKKGERDLGKEVGIAGVVALKCDVAWIGSGYSFGLTAVQDATDTFKTNTKKRPMVLMVDGWASTQRYSGIWSGDQKGGEWEFIRFHIPTFIGSGLSGQPLVGSDIDGIYAGGVKEINVRDYQWKAFTPLQFNMDGWGSKPKTPFSYDAEATEINRAYLKLKSMLMPYNYTIGHESTEGLPMIRAMFLEFPKETLAYTLASQYQFMWGPYILVAPIYNADYKEGTSVRNDIYLPDENVIWSDFFTGARYKGGIILNNFMCPLWKIPIFIKSGSIIPLVNPNNNPQEIDRSKRILVLYPGDETDFEVYEDDGITSEHLNKMYAKSKITMFKSSSNMSENVHIKINKTQGTHSCIVKQRKTILHLVASDEPLDVKLTINGRDIKIAKASTSSDFEKHDNIFIFNKKFFINPYLEKFGELSTSQKVISIKIQEVDVTCDEIRLKIRGYNYSGKTFGDWSKSSFLRPNNFRTVQSLNPLSSIALTWDYEIGASFYEIEINSHIYTNIKATPFTIHGLNCDAKYTMKIRAVKDNEVSDWSETIAAQTGLNTS